MDNKEIDCEARERYSKEVKKVIEKFKKKGNFEAAYVLSIRGNINTEDPNKECSE